MEEQQRLLAIAKQSLHSSLTGGGVHCISGGIKYHFKPIPGITHNCVSYYNLNIHFSNMFCWPKAIKWVFSPMNWSKCKSHPYSLRSFSPCPSIDGAPSSLFTRRALDTSWSAVLCLAHQHQKELIVLSAGCLWPPCSTFISHTPSVLLINH